MTAHAPVPCSFERSKRMEIAVLAAALYFIHVVDGHVCVRGESWDCTHSCPRWSSAQINDDKLATNFAAMSL